MGINDSFGHQYMTFGILLCLWTYLKNRFQQVI